MKPYFLLSLQAAALIAGCSGPASPPERKSGNSADATAAVSPENSAAAPPVQPAAPGTPAGLPDDRTPVSEAPFATASAQGAADTVQHYYALIEAGKYAEARRLWASGGDASGKTESEFAADFRNYRDYHAEVGAPGRIEGAAGSLYVDVPVQLYGRLKDGSPFREPGTVTLRRVNDVPGATAEQRRWHISDIAAGNAPKG